MEESRRTIVLWESPREGESCGRVGEPWKYPGGLGFGVLLLCLSKSFPIHQALGVYFCHAAYPLPTQHQVVLPMLGLGNGAMQ